MEKLIAKLLERYLEEFKAEVEKIFDEALEEAQKPGRTLEGSVALALGRVRRVTLEQLVSQDIGVKDGHRADDHAGTSDPSDHR